MNQLTNLLVEAIVSLTSHWHNLTLFLQQGNNEDILQPASLNVPELHWLTWRGAYSEQPVCSHWKLLFTISDVTSTTSREGLRGGGKNVEISRTLWQRANSTLNWPIDWQSNPSRCWMHTPTIANRAKTKSTTQTHRGRESKDRDIQTALRREGDRQQH